MFCFVEEVAENAVQAQDDRRVLVVQSAANRVAQERVNLVVSGWDGDDRSGAIFNIHNQFSPILDLDCKGMSGGDDRRGRRGGPQDR